MTSDITEIFVPGTLPRVLRRDEFLPSDNYYTFVPSGEAVREPKDADVITSEIIGSSLHAPVIDLDLPVALVPSSTLGHYHLYIDKPMTYRQMMKLLKVMRDVGIVEDGYYRATKKRGRASVRLPWIKKR